MAFTIIPATTEHAEGYAAVMVQSWHSAYAGIIPRRYLDEQVTMEKYGSFIHDVLSLCHHHYVAVLDGRIIGVFTVAKLRDEGAGEQDGELIAIYLHPEEIGKGYGRQMMDEAIEKLRVMRFTSVSIWVLEQNTSARRFYEKFGFVPDGTRKEIIIEKSLVEMRYRKDIIT